MINPVYALSIGAALLAIAALVFWPRQGLWARWNAGRLKKTQEVVEDALKHLFECEYRRSACTPESIAHALSVSRDEAATIIERLVALRLIERDGERLLLTGEGRTYALRMVRTHRLWELYLAEQTSVKEYEWHSEAERREHALSPDETDAISRHLGNPLYDPHGDPIPTITGDVPAADGVLLSTLNTGDRGRVMHMEDEPPAVYAQLSALGMQLGSMIHVLASSPKRLIVDLDGNDVILASEVAANVTVLPLELAEPAAVGSRTLASLAVGESGIVAGIAPRCRGMQRRRLMDLGLIPGTPVRAELRSTGGDPTAYAIRGASIALRKQQAELVLLEEN